MRGNIISGRQWTAATSSTGLSLSMTLIDQNREDNSHSDTESKNYRVGHKPIHLCSSHLGTYSEIAQMVVHVEKYSIFQWKKYKRNSKLRLVVLDVHSPPLCRMVH